MSAVRTTFNRTIGRAKNLYTVVLAIGGFLFIAALLFSFGLASAEGGRNSLAVVMAISLSSVLPVLAAFLAMDVWSDERQSGRIDMLLTVSVRERDYVLGKFLGVWTILLMTSALFVLVSVGALLFFAPRTLAGSSVLHFVLVWLAAAVQGAAWSAAAVMLSAVFSNAAAALCSSLVMLVVIPRGLWAGILTFCGVGRLSLGEMPFDAHVVDIASGLLPLGTIAAYGVAVILLLLVATKCVASYRLVGCGAIGLRISTGVSVVLAAIVGLLTVLFAMRMNPTIDVSTAGATVALSPRTRSILADAGSGVTITCFLPRNDSRFRGVSRLLRLFSRESASVSGSAIELRFVDPRWDIGAAERLIHAGVAENSLVFERGRQMVSVPIDESCGERLCAATIRRIASVSRRRNIYWTTGHGEFAFDGYGSVGMSDIARDLVREGFRNSVIDLATAQQIPGDCALILIAGAKNDFSRVEISLLDSYLREGGRLLVLLGSVASGGVGSMLPSWGIKPSSLPNQSSVKTLTGAEVLVSAFSDHEIGSPLRGSRIVMDQPVAFVPSSVAETGTGVDRIDFSPVAEVGESAVVAAVERGGGMGRDLALRPTRIVVIGDRSLVLNGQLAVRASANRDFFLNCVAYLSGMDAHAFGGDGWDVLETGLDRMSRMRHLVFTAGVVPLLVIVVMLLAIIRRNRRI